ncbi:cupin domain-containing protein [Alphaproteobacteria bacterium GH1-50]|uniref:Cupin domain-containing protein n=1 Tax=Kangsaoukella pontilimi TaxID=2691042 RepID=A0A7C9IGB5_9RHOB|nr:cupin domain-containing protein [Kangsaoukella pontilimi]MXQ06782.1 cupin domain-containing protein [Kangsaoukella pontilimi]
MIRFASTSRKKTAAAVLSAIVASSGTAFADGEFPTEHKGLAVEQLGVVSSDSMARQVGLDGHILLLRRITIEPGGQIAHHSAAKVPGVVYMETGAWTEGRETGETVHKAGETFIEDADTVHWFYNRGDEPASALVCDIKPAS